ncbi:MAG: hypothetical protein DRJ45_06880 [Thermoprotei archaeon]|nr:MAG: hypothetical protein DRJ45_06880 [Thermoprotei archaeon]
MWKEYLWKISYFISLYSVLVFLSSPIRFCIPIGFLTTRFFLTYCFILPTITLVIFITIYRFKKDFIESPYKFYSKVIFYLTFLLFVTWPLGIIFRRRIEDVYMSWFTLGVGTIWLIAYTYVQLKLGKKRSEKYDITMPWIYSPLERKIIKK